MSQATVNRLQPLVLTLTLDASTSAHLTSLRNELFPADRNFLNAHLTLFHALPGDSRSTIERELDSLCERQSGKRTRVDITKPFRMKQGMAVSVHSHFWIEKLHAEMMKAWQRHGIRLTKQDSRPLTSPHVTVQNKVQDEQAVQSAFERLQADWSDSTGFAEGFELYEYQRGGAWRALRKFPFERPAQ